MNTFSKATLFATAIALSFSACKKGEDDPFLSLRSRDAKITNTWNLTNIDGKTTSVNKQPQITVDPITFQTINTIKTTTTVETTTFSGSTKTVSSTATVNDNGTITTGTPESTNYTYSQTLEIKKGGEYTISETSTQNFSTTPSDPNNGVTETSKNTGQWNWADDNKAKSILVLDGDNYDITKLSKKELVLTQNYSYDNSSTKNAQTQGSYSSNGSTTYTYEAK